jgi:hypothetical protein
LGKEAVACRSKRNTSSISNGSLRAAAQPQRRPVPRASPHVPPRLFLAALASGMASSLFAPLQPASGIYERADKP